MPKVHRCRFVELQPRAITALCFSPSGKHAAVAREGGSLEIWNVQSGWHQQAVIPASPNSIATVGPRSLVWISHDASASDAALVHHGSYQYCEGRLFSGGIEGRVVEWDLQRLCQQLSSPSYGGAIWQMAADPHHKLLALACEDQLRMFSIDEVGVSYLRSFVQESGRILCVAWSFDGSTLWSGDDKGRVRQWDVKNWACIRTVTCVKQNKHVPIVWDVAVLRDGTLVTADSTGKTSFWDCKTGTLLQSLQQHCADVLTLAVAYLPQSTECLLFGDSDSILPGSKRNRKGQTKAENNSVELVFSSGVDSKVAVFRRVPVDQNISKWVYSNSRRIHTHDVTAMAASQNGYLVTGGTDTLLGVYSVKRFFFDSPKRLLPFSHRPGQNFSISNHSRILLCGYGSHIYLWRLATVDNFSGGEVQPQLLFRLKVTAPSVYCAALSPDGKFFAFSDGATSRLYSIKFDSTANSEVSLLKLKKYEGASRIVFTKDDMVVLAHIHSKTLSIEPVHRRKANTASRHVDLANFGPVVSLSVSKNAKWLAVGTACNSILIISTQTASVIATLPALGSQHTDIQFHPNKSWLGISTVHNQIYIYDFLKNSLTRWSKSHSENLPLELRERKEKITGFCFHPVESQLLVYGHSYLCHIDLNKAVPRRVFEWPFHDSYTERPGVNEDHKASEDSSGLEPNFVFIKKYRTILFASYLASDELVVVEQPWHAVAEKLPKAMYRQHYRT